MVLSIVPNGLGPTVRCAASGEDGYEDDGQHHEAGAGREPGAAKPPEALQAWRATGILVGLAHRGDDGTPDGLRCSRATRRCARLLPVTAAPI